MYSNRVLFIGLLGLVLFLAAGCTPALYVPAADDASRSEQALDQLMAGRKLYIGRCASCHNLYLPQQYTRQEWRHQLDEMQGKSGIDQKQKELILNYLVARSK